jgi:hypothetical protein
VLDLRESISLRTGEGLFFGELAKFGGGRMEVESEGRFELRSEVEFQLKLPGFNSTVYGVARVLRVISRTAFLSQVTLRIIRMREKDRILLQRFVAYSARGRSQEQSAWDGEADAAEGNPWGIRPIDAEQQTAAGRIAHRDAQRARFEPSGNPSSGSGASQGVRAFVSPPPSRAPSSSSVPSLRNPVRPPSSGGSGSPGPSLASRDKPRADLSGGSAGTAPAGTHVSGRAALGATIERHEEEQRRRRRGEPDLSDHDGHAAQRPAPPPSATQRRELRSQPRPTPARGQSPRLPNPADPQVSLRLGASPPQVFVRYSSRATFLSDYQAFLSRDLLFLKYVQTPPEQGSRLSVNMMLPSGLGLTIEATVHSVLSTGFGVSLQLDRDARALLSSATRV